MQTLNWAQRVELERPPLGPIPLSVLRKALELQTAAGAAINLTLRLCRFLTWQDHRPFALIPPERPLVIRMYCSGRSPNYNRYPR